ncbi:MAG: 50S ribosomal protein L28 [Verrucomicrobia bacterium]|nr:50S ribosomal protein L28 [Verrucomicrobiota bacterium]
MSRICEICGKHPSAGRKICRRGLAKKDGGIGLKTTGVTRRRFLPNIQTVKVKDPNGTVRHAKVCAQCISAGKIAKA